MTKQPMRVWRTGALAVVMAALGQASSAVGRSGVEERQAVRRHSPYGVAETVLRIEASARQRGMAVFARFEQGAKVAPERAGGAGQVIVLESVEGGTPVVMGDTPPRMEVPLSVLVRRAGEGGTEVLIGAGPQWDAMPQALAHDLAELSQVVGDALQA